MFLLLYMTIAVCYAIYIYGFIKKNKISTFICLALATFFVGGAYVMADYDSYNNMFCMMKTVESLNSLDVMSYAGYSSADYGYLFTNYIFYKLGVDFAEYRLIMIGMFLLIIMRESNKIIDSVLLVVLCYIIYPLFMDGIQFRNYFVEIALLFAVCQLMLLNFKNKINYILLLLIATSFHKIALVYIPFVVWLSLRNYSWGRTIRKIVLAFGACSPLFTNMILNHIDAIYLMALEAGQYTSYLNQDFRIRHYLAYCLVLFCAFFVNYVYHMSVKFNYNDMQIRFVYIVKEMFLYLLALSPLYLLSTDLIRIPRNTLLLIYIVVVIYIQGFSSKYIKAILVSIVLLLCGIYGYIDFYRNAGAENMETIINYNYLYEYFF